MSVRQRQIRFRAKMLSHICFIVMSIVGRPRGETISQLRGVRDKDLACVNLLPM